MILLLDIGNTRLKWRFLKGKSLVPGGELVHEELLDSALLDKLWGGLDAPSAILGVSVAQPSVVVQLSAWCNAQWRLVPTMISSTVAAGGVRNGYHQPERLGADRWLAMIGARALFNSGCCIADCGTAVTVDCLDQQGNHLGGLILPGLSLMAQCVVAATANVVMTHQTSNRWLGRDTEGCLTGGALNAITATLERTAHRFELDTGQAITRVITGGDAKQLHANLDTAWRYEPDLIFVGLAALATEPSR